MEVSGLIETGKIIRKKRSETGKIVNTPVRIVQSRLILSVEQFERKRHEAFSYYWRGSV